MTTPAIVVFDSGLGGLTVYREVAKLLPDARYVYWADDAFFPYSDQDEATLTERVVEVMERIVRDHSPDLVVVACNTASTLVLPHLRTRFPVPFVGTVPAIKPACANSESKLVSILGTQATVKREYTQGLIRDFAGDCDVTLVGSSSLAALAEASLRDEPVSDADLAREIAPCFVEADGRRTDVVVLACTHYPLLRERLERLALWPVEWLDPAPAIARRVADLLGAAGNRASGQSGKEQATVDPPRAVFSSGTAPSEALRASLHRFGFEAP